MLGTEDFRLFFSKYWKKVLDFLRKKVENLRFRAHTIVHRLLGVPEIDYSMCSEPKIFGGSGDFGKNVLDFLRKKVENLRFRAHTIVHRLLGVPEMDYSMCPEPKIFGFFSQKI